MLKRSLCLLLAVAAGALYAGLALAAAPTIYVQNTSTVIADAQLQAALPAFQAQVSLDFEPVWNLDALLVFTGAADPPAGAWTITVSDDATIFGALGYHDVCHQDGHGVPCGFVFAKTTLDYGEDPNLTLSHELLEMLADPFTTTMAKVGSRLYIQEVCDAPEDTAYSYTRAGTDGSPVELSDFVTPFWFRPGHLGPYDFRGFIRRPLQLLPGGYISWWENGVWHQDFKSTAHAPLE